MYISDSGSLRPFLNNLDDFIGCKLVPSISQLVPFLITWRSFDMCEWPTIFFYDSDGSGPDLICATSNCRRFKIVVECVIKFYFALIKYASLV